jgi:Tol biopolymer transport system component
MLPGSEKMFGPRWTPDGRFVIAMPHDKWDRLMIFDFASQKWRELVSYHAANHQLSPDGEWVYFESEHEGSHLARVRLHDGQLERLFDSADLNRSSLMRCRMAGG